MLLVLAVAFSAAAAVVVGYFGLGQNPDSDDYYAMIREGLANNQANLALQGAEGLMQLNPQSSLHSGNLCLIQEYFGQQDNAACYARAVAIIKSNSMDATTLFDYALLLLLANDPNAEQAANAYMDSVPVPDAEYFQELRMYDRPRLVRQLLQPLGAPR